MSGTTFLRGENPLKADKLNAAFSERVSRRGDTMQGSLNLAHDPLAPLEAATKQYVDHFAGSGGLTVPTGAYIGATPPGSVAAPLWWDSVSGQLFIQYNDGSSTQWVSASNLGMSMLEGSFLPLTGGTVTGGTTFNAGLTSTGLHSPGIHFLGLSGADGPSNNWLYANISVSGGFTGGDPAADLASGVNKILVTDGAINLGAALYVQFVENGNADPTNAGERQATQSRMIVHGQVGTGGGIFVAQSSIAYAIGSQGGLGGWTGTDSPTNNHFAGNLFGGNDNAWLDTGASNYWLIIGREINCSIFGSASVYQRIGLLEITKPSTRQAQGDDVGLMFATEDAANPFAHKNAIQFGASTNRHTVTDSLIKIVARTYPTPATPAYVNGLDFSQATFSGNALATPGFAVNGAGQITATRLNLSSLPTSATGLTTGDIWRNGTALVII